MTPDILMHLVHLQNHMISALNVRNIISNLELNSMVCKAEHVFFSFVSGRLIFLGLGFNDLAESDLNQKKERKLR